MSETIQPVVQHHIPHDLNPHTDICKNQKPHSVTWPDTYIALFYLAIRHGTAERGLVPGQSLPGKCRIGYDAACI